MTFVQIILSISLGIVCTAAVNSDATYAEESIASKDVKATWHQGTVTLEDVKTGRRFLASIKLGSVSAVECRAESVIDSVWGRGQSLTIHDATGDVNRVILFDSMPFAVLQRTIVNSTSTERVVDKDAMFEGQVDIGVAHETLKTMSTAGLEDVAEHPGGYCFMAIGDPSTLHGVVCGWLTHARGSGIVFSDVQDDAALLRARIDYGDLRVPAEAETQSETLVIGYFDDIRVGLEQYGDAIAKQLDIKLLAQPSVYCTWYHGGASDEERIAKNTDFTAERLVPYGFHVMQIDDKWQAGVSKNGPRKDFSRILEEGPYPSGMKKTADYISGKGLIPGIWFMPFAGTWNDPYWGDKQELFYKEGRSTNNHIDNTNGGQRPDFPQGEAPFVARWGGTCLDMTNPKTQEYLRSIVHRIAHDWGYKYFKMDGLWTGTGTRLQYVNSHYIDDDLGQPKRFDSRITPIEAYRKGLDIIRDTAGDDVFFLGCCAPQNMRSLAPAFGKVDAMRVGPDNGARPEGLVRGPMFSNRVFFLNKRVWYNDPDPVYVRQTFPEQMAKTSVSWTAITGSLHSSSYSYYELPDDRLEILMRSLPSHGLKTARPVDYLEYDPARVWLLTDERGEMRKDVVGLFNWNVKETERIEYSLDRIGLPKADAYVGFNFWANQFIPPFADTISADVAPGGCSIISVRPVVDHPQVISTSRHVTQGVVDLTNENWDQENGTLSGTSHVVGGDDYELRLVVPAGPKSWLIKNAELIDAPKDAEINFTQTGPTVRVRISSPTCSDINWRTVFEPGAVATVAPAAVSGVQASIDLDRVVLNWASSKAFGYRVSRNDEVLAEIASESYVDRDCKLGQSYTYAVSTKNWSGQWSEPSKVTVQLPEKLQIPDAPPKPQVFCSELKPVKSSTGFGILGINQSCVKTPLTLNGVVYEKGIGAHAPSTLVYRMPKNAKRFVATVGIDDNKITDDRSSIVFKVIGDVKEMGEPPVILARSPVLKNTSRRVWHFDVPLNERLRELHLIAEDAGDGKAADHANWVNAGFLTEAKK